MSMITGVGGTSGSSQNDNSIQMDRMEGNTLDKDAFFKLLITQLQNQDPLKPMEDKEFIAQMAQFSSLEQMQSMNENMEQFLQMKSLAEGASLIGKTVEKRVEEGGSVDIISGKVTKISFKDGEAYAQLDDELESTIPVNDINAIY